MELKLRMELVPETAHYKNLRNVIGQTKWNKVRKAVNARQDYAVKQCY